MRTRWLEAEVRACLADTPAVFVHGPRRAGKSTLAGMVAASLGMSSVSFDNRDERRRAKADPDGYLADLGSGVFLDEIQRVPELFLAIKAAIDQRPAPGRFLLTGSTNLALAGGLADALVGRVAILDLHPFSQGEIDGHREGFLAAALATETNLLCAAQADRSEVFARAIRGGFPEVVARDDPARRGRWCKDYLDTVVSRQAGDVQDIARKAELKTILAKVALRTGTPTNLASLSRELGIPWASLRRYLLLLEGIHVITASPAWRPGRGARAGKRQRLHLVDSGLLAHLLGVDGGTISAAGDAAGMILETFALQELRRQASLRSSSPAIQHYWREEGDEVDIVLETPGGEVVGIEIKATSSPGKRAFRGLQRLAAVAKGRFLRGILLCTTSRSWPYGENLHALPLSSLWRLGAGG